MWKTWTVQGALLAVMILAGGCSEWVDVTSVYGPGVRFRDDAHCYAWAPDSSRSAGEGRPENPDADRLIRELVDAHLARKGFEKVPASAKPDFWIDYVARKRPRADANDFTEPMYLEGRLDIVALSPSNSKMIWTGSAEAKLDNTASPDVRRKRLDRVIGKILDKAPSARKKF